MTTPEENDPLIQSTSVALDDAGTFFPKESEPSFTWAGELEAPGAPAKSGSIQDSAMNLAACALGASMLSLPYAMEVSGPVVSFSLLLAFGVMSYYAAQAVVKAGKACGKSSYSAIVTDYFGPTEGAVCDILLSVALAVAAISYIVGLRDLMPNLLGVFETVPKPMRVIGVLVVLFPVTLVSNLAAFGFASTLAAIGCYIQAFFLVVQMMNGIPGKAEGPPLLEKTEIFDLTGVIYSLPMVCFVYAFHYVLTDTLSELNDPTDQRMASVSRNTIFILVGCYIPVALSGYLMVTGRCVDSNLLNCLPSDAFAVKVANWSIGGLLFITYSLFIIPLRRKLEGAVYGVQTTSMVDPRRLTIAGALAGTIAIISISLADLGLANTIAGGCISLVMFYYPGKLLLNLEKDQPLAERKRMDVAVGAFFMVVGALICFSGFFGNILFQEESLGEVPLVQSARNMTKNVTT